jgi:hypothetical protein
MRTAPKMRCNFRFTVVSLGGILSNLNFLCPHNKTTEFFSINLAVFPAAPHPTSNTYF